VKSVDLNTEEQALFDALEFDAMKLRDHVHARENGENAAQLTTSLLDRNAIPEFRVSVFSDDRFAIGRGPSPLKCFQRNGNDREETLRHPHFLAWLRYFILGPNLPSSFTGEFRNFVWNLGHVSSSDYSSIAKKTRVSLPLKTMPD